MDKFRGSLSAADACTAVAAGIRNIVPEAQVVTVPVADGGEGTIDIAVHAGFVARRCRVTGPNGDDIEAIWALREQGDRHEALIEVAQAVGHHTMPHSQRDVMTASSVGVGQLISDALSAGATSISVGVGGTLTSDGGAGMLRELGVAFFGDNGADLPPGAGSLRELSRVDLAGLDPRIESCEIRVVTDVDNPLCGTNGAASVFGPQKGASDDDVTTLNAGLTRLVGTLASEIDSGWVLECAGAAGAGAGGGIAFAATALLGARRISGGALLEELLDLSHVVQDADIVVTGEGSLDRQSLGGKAPALVARAATAAGVRVVAACGVSSLSEEEICELRLSAVYSLSDLAHDVSDSMARASELLGAVGERMAKEWLEPESRGAPAARGTLSATASVMG